MPEDQGLANVATVPASVRLTGSTGSASITDSAVRGVGAAGILTAIKWVLERFVADFTVGDWDALAPFLMLVAFVLWGAFDKWVRPRIGSS